MGGGAVLHPTTGAQFELTQQKAVDVSLAFHLTLSYSNRKWRKLFFAAGDGDFKTPIQHLVELENVDLILIGTMGTISEELRPYARDIVKVDELAGQLSGRGRRRWRELGSRSCRRYRCLPSRSAGAGRLGGRRVPRGSANRAGDPPTMANSGTGPIRFSTVALSEADTRAKLIDPAIYARGWSEDMICRETTLGAVEIVAGKARRRSGGRTDYTLRVRVSTETQPVAVALIEAKKDTLPPGHGLDQAKGYLRGLQPQRPVRLLLQRLPVRGVRPLDRHDDRPRGRYPSFHAGRTPRSLRAHHGLLARSARRQAAARCATRAARVSAGIFRTRPSAPSSRRWRSSAAKGRPPRALLSLATGTGKTFIACQPAEADRRRGPAEARAVPVRPRRTADPGPQGDAGRLRRRRRRGVRGSGRHGTTRRTPASTSPPTRRSASTATTATRRSSSATIRRTTSLTSSSTSATAPPGANGPSC